jgi:hypothetical protein
MLQQECAVRIGEILRRLEGRLEKRILGIARGVLRHLRHHRRDQVERLPDFRKLLQNPRHAVVVLEGVHARPRQLVLAGDQVLVEGLVHVPEEAQIDARHDVVIG